MKNKEQVEIQEKMTNVIAAMSKAFEHNAELEHGEIVNLYLEKYNYLDIHNPEHFNLLLFNTVDQQIHLIEKEAFSHMKHTDPNKFHQATFMYRHYDFVERHLETVIYKEEGVACSADKTRWLIDTYLVYMETGKLPEGKVSGQYWKPSAGTWTEWMDFITGVYKLYYGETDDYLISREALATAYQAKREKQ